jgi:hypothetical protein
MVAGSAAEPFGGVDCAPLDGDAVLDDPDVEVEVEGVLVAAEATPAAPIPAPATTAPVANMRRNLRGFLDIVGVLLAFCSHREFPGAAPPCGSELGPACGTAASLL